MQALLYILFFGCMLFGAMFFTVARSAIHEIEGILFLLIGAVLLAGAAVFGAVERQKNESRKLTEAVNAQSDIAHSDAIDLRKLMQDLPPELPPSVLPADPALVGLSALPKVLHTPPAKHEANLESRLREQNEGRVT